MEYPRQALEWYNTVSGNDGSVADMWKHPQNPHRDSPIESVEDKDRMLRFPDKSFIKFGPTGIGAWIGGQTGSSRYLFSASEEGLLHHDAQTRTPMMYGDRPAKPIPWGVPVDTEAVGKFLENPQTMLAIKDEHLGVTVERLHESLMSAAASLPKQPEAAEVLAASHPRLLATLASMGVGADETYTGQVVKDAMAILQKGPRRPLFKVTPPKEEPKPRYTYRMPIGKIQEELAKAGFSPVNPNLGAQASSVDDHVPEGTDVQVPPARTLKESLAYRHIVNERFHVHGTKTLADLDEMSRGIGFKRFQDGSQVAYDLTPEGRLTFKVNTIRVSVPHLTETPGMHHTYIREHKSGVMNKTRDVLPDGTPNPDAGNYYFWPLTVTHSVIKTGEDGNLYASEPVVHRVGVLDDPEPTPKLGATAAQVLESMSEPQSSRGESLYAADQRIKLAESRAKILRDFTSQVMGWHESGSRSREIDVSGSLFAKAHASLSLGQIAAHEDLPAGIYQQLEKLVGSQEGQDALNALADVYTSSHLVDSTAHHKALRDFVTRNAHLHPDNMARGREPFHPPPVGSPNDRQEYWAFHWKKIYGMMRGIIASTSKDAADSSRSEQRAAHGRHAAQELVQWLLHNSPDNTVHAGLAWSQRAFQGADDKEYAALAPEASEVPKVGGSKPIPILPAHKRVRALNPNDVVPDDDTGTPRPEGEEDERRGAGSSYTVRVTTPDGPQTIEVPITPESHPGVFSAKTIGTLQRAVAAIVHVPEVRPGSYGSKVKEGQALRGTVRPVRATVVLEDGSFLHFPNLGKGDSVARLNSTDPRSPSKGEKEYRVKYAVMDTATNTFLTESSGIPKLYTRDAAVGKAAGTGRGKYFLLPVYHPNRGYSDFMDSSRSESESAEVRSRAGAVAKGKVALSIPPKMEGMPITRGPRKSDGTYYRTPVWMSHKHGPLTVAVKGDGSWVRIRHTWMDEIHADAVKAYVAHLKGLRAGLRTELVEESTTEPTPESIEDVRAWLKEEEEKKAEKKVAEARRSRDRRRAKNGPPMPSRGTPDRKTMTPLRGATREEMVERLRVQYQKDPELALKIAKIRGISMDEVLRASGE